MRNTREQRERVEEEEILPGYFVERRTLLTGVGGLLPGGTMPGITLAASRDDSEIPRTFEQFIAGANPLAEQLVGDTSLAGQDHYLPWIATLSANLQSVPVPTVRGVSTSRRRCGHAPISAPPCLAIGYAPVNVFERIYEASWEFDD